VGASKNATEHRFGRDCGDVVSGFLLYQVFVTELDSHFTSHHGAGGERRLSPIACSSFDTRWHLMPKMGVGTHGLTHRLEK
jgi:hypothetical protein